MSAWSFPAEEPDGVGFQLLNELGPSGKGALIHPRVVAVYLHVDDGILVSARRKGAAQLSDQWAHRCAKALEDVGFVIKEVVPDSELERVVGYAPERSPPALGMRPSKAAQLEGALRFLSQRRFVDLEQLRSLVGVWLWAALLCRETLSIPHAIFRMLESDGPRARAMWPSVSSELSAMARAVPFLRTDLGRPVSHTILASDAEGANGVDNGGFGIVATEVSAQMIQMILERGTTPQFAVATLDGEIRGLGDPERKHQRHIPFTSLPSEVFEGDCASWLPVSWGRWRWADHITLGESRGAVRALSIAAAHPKSHGHLFFSLQDNMAVSGATRKGRSTAISMNYLLRRRAGLALAAAIRMFYPWIQTSAMPADWLSRYR